MQKSFWWIDAIEKCIQDIPQVMCSKIVSIDVSGQQHGFVPINSKGEVFLIPVKFWCDTSTKKQCLEWTEKFGGEDKLMEEIGNPILVSYTVSKILWFKQKFPEKFKEMLAVLLPHDYINYYLTGSIAMEYGDASGTSLLEIRNREVE